MFRKTAAVLFLLPCIAPAVRADVVLDWNTTLNEAIIATPSKHNPGNPTRAMAMLNAAIYDIFQAVDRTHSPFKVNQHAPGADVNAAVARAAYLVLSDTYEEQQSMIDAALNARLGPGPYTPAQQAGIALGNYIGQHYVNSHANDGHNLPDAYTPTIGVGHWSPDPLISPEQKGWGADWGFVTPWVMPDPTHFNSMIGVPSFNDQEYVDAFNQVKQYGSRTGSQRSTDQTNIGLFWAYDRPNLPNAPGLGPPPVLFMQSMMQIAEQVGNSPADNARMFAMASVSQADAAIAAWFVKYDVDYWRPISAIRATPGNDDGNPNTIEDPNWVYLGSPGSDPNSADDDFTPPFPAYVSGHATMGGAIFKSLEKFYKTNSFKEADERFGTDDVPDDGMYSLFSNEFDANGMAGMTRYFRRFTQDESIDENNNGILDVMNVGEENSPEGENGTSRIYLGVHWLFDQRHGTALGNAIANYTASHYFQPVPEPCAIVLAAIAAVGCSLRRRLVANRK